MSTETLTCPYCNASIGIQAGWSAGQRIVCPRCGDAFPLRLDDSISDRPRSSQPSPATLMIDSPATNVSLPSRWSNRLIAGLLLGFMFLMAGGGLAFMLVTQQQRRAYDTSRPPRRPGKQRGVPEADVSSPSAGTRGGVASVAPDKLAALGYLPSGVNFLIAARIPELLASPLGAQMLRDPLKVGESQFHLEKLSEWVGFRLEDLDHLVFAARIDDAVLPPFYVVLRTVGPYDGEQLRQRLKGKSVPSLSKKKLYSFHVPQQDIQLHAWFADERTVVLALFADQLEELPSQPVEDLRQLPQELRTILKQRREPVAPAWVAGHSSNWNQTSAAMFLNRKNKEKLASLRTFGIWIAPDESLIIKGVFACRDEPGARGLEQHFRSLCGPDADFKSALDGPWLTLQLQTTPDFLARVLKR